MTDSGDTRPTSRFSWLRDILRRGPFGRRVWGTRRDLDAATRRVQIDIIRRELGRNVAVAPTRDGSVSYLFHPDRALVLASHVAEVEGFFAENSGTYRGTGSYERLIDGELVLYTFPPRSDSGEVALLADLDVLDERVGEGVATPDHVLYVVGRPGGFCPAIEPMPPPGPEPLPPLNKEPDAGRGVRVSVVDTGWYPPAAHHPATTWLSSGVEGDEEQLKTDGTTSLIHEYAGHGTFVAGVVKCMAPGADIEIEGALTKGGAIYESEITAELNQAMLDYEDDPTTPEFDPRPPDILSISAGTHTRKDFGLLGFQVLGAIFNWDQNEIGPLIVAAAGNDSSQQKFWPAAFDWVLSVGSLDADGKRSDFSNYGKWVDVWAQGRDLVNAFPKGEYTYIEPKSGKLCGTKQMFDGLARWSGTSFSTPVVSGAIAAYMSEKGCTARQARDALIKQAAVMNDPKVGPLKALGPPFVP